ncbi:MAG: Fe-S cluster assembly protein SufD [Herpetosiphon sp.]
MLAHNSPTFGTVLADAIGTGPLAEHQQSALEHVRTAAMPIWKRTRLEELNFDALYPTFGSAEISVADAGGAYVADLQTALRERPELFKSHFARAVPSTKNKWVAYNAALSQDGLVVHVPRNVDVPSPIRVRYRLPNAGAAILPRTLVIAEANSNVTVIEEYVSDALDGQALVLPVSEVFAADGARVRFMSLQTLDPKAYLVGTQTVVADRDSSVYWLAGAVGAHVQHMEMETRLEGNGSNLDWVGFTFANGEQNILWGPKVSHIGRSTTAQINWKSAVADHGYAVFDGMIKIMKTAQGTNSDLRDNVLHLSPAARSDSIPGLEIDANEVKAGHGSTSGQVDEEQLFYLRARGLDRKSALRMIVLGFFASIVERVPLEDVRDHVLELIDSKLY